MMSSKGLVTEKRVVLPPVVVFFWLPLLVPASQVCLASALYISVVGRLYFISFTDITPTGQTNSGPTAIVQLSIVLGTRPLEHDGSMFSQSPSIVISQGFYHHQCQLILPFQDFMIDRSCHNIVHAATL